LCSEMCCLECLILEDWLVIEVLPNLKHCNVSAQSSDV
jgi:hypothetical protein